MTKQEDYSAYLKEKFPPKKEFIKRMESLIGIEDTKVFFDISYTKCPTSIRCNTLKITPEELKKRLKNYGWKLSQPLKGFPEIFTIESKLSPGEIGKTKEHLLGYYYVQEISSMLPMLALQPKEGDFVLDLCSSPGSKTTQAAAQMNNGGTIIANEISLGRVGILNSNLERCGVANTIVTRKEGVALCERFLKKTQFKFDKILVDAPCSGEGTLRKSPRTLEMWNINMIKKIASVQRNLSEAAIRLLKVGGTLVYSTCTLAPEENEMIINNLLNNFDIEIEQLKLPLKFRKGITNWEGKKLSGDCDKCLRLYPQDNNTDGFFVTKIKKLSEGK